MQSNITLKTISRKVLSVGLSLLFFLLLSTGPIQAQTIITNNPTADNGNALITFNLTNNNATGIIVTQLWCMPGATNPAMPTAVFFKPSAINGAPGAISGANGWTQFGSGTINAVANTVQAFVTGTTLLIPPGSTYGIAVQGTSIRYNGAGTTGLPVTVTAGGATFATGPNIGYGGGVAPGAPINSPRYFIGQIHFIAAVACSGTPTPGNTTSTATSVCPGTPFTLGTQNPTAGTGVTYTYQSGPSASGPFTTIPASGTGSTFTTTQTAATYYQVLVQCGAGAPVPATPVFVGLNPTTACYCASTATNTADEDVFNVTLGTLNNSSVCASVGPGPGSVNSLYANYTSGTGAPAAPSLVTGTPYPLSVGIGTCGTGNFTNSAAVWIDFNQNGNFSDPGERVFTSASAVGAHTETTTITIPTTATLGTTRMRVIVDEIGNSSNIPVCGTYTYGETEDYLVTIAPCVPPALTSQPANAAVSCGGTATFSVTTSGSPSTFQWQFRPTTSGLWTDLTNTPPYSGVTTSTLTVTSATAALNGYQYRVLYTNGCGGPDASTPATLTVNALSISITPSTANYCSVGGTPVLISVPNSSNTLQFPNTASQTIPDGIVAGITKTFNVTGVTGTVTSARLILNVTHAYVSDVIVALKAPNGNILNLDYGISSTFVANTANLINTTFTSVPGAPLLSSVGGPYTGTFRPDARLTPIAPTVPTGPTGFAANVNTFAQLFSTPNGTWTLAMYDYGTPDVGTFNNAILELTFGAAPATGIFSPLPGLFTDAAGTIPYTGTAVSQVYAAPGSTTTYTAVVSTATCTAGSSTSTVTVNTPAAGTPVVASAGGCTNGNTSFTVTGITGGPNFTYVWEMSTNGGSTYTTVTNGSGYSGATTATLTIANPTAAMAGYLYRVKVTAAGCAGTTTLTSNAATLTTISAPVVVTSVAPTASVMPGTTTTLTAAVSGTNGVITYQWFRNGVAVPGATSNMLVVGVDGLGTYTVKVTDANGCSAVSSTPLEISISAAASNTFYIYPSPNNGKFQVRYYNAKATVTSADAAMLNVFDSKGTRVFTQRYSIIGPYTQMNVDMGTHGSGVYRVELADSKGDRLQTGSVIVY